MTSVWVIEKGSYSDYRVVGVYDTKDKAERVAEACNASDRNYDHATVAEWPLNPGHTQINQGRKRFHITMLKNGDVERANQTDISYYSLSDEYSIWRRTAAPAYKDKGVPDALSATVWGRDQKHAVKIVNERRAQMIANGDW